jgi:hypothetical protein
VAAAVAESAPNDDGTRSDANVDHIAQEIGNLASGFFHGKPVGGSVGADRPQPDGRGANPLGAELSPVCGCC